MPRFYFDVREGTRFTPDTRPRIRQLGHRRTGGCPCGSRDQLPKVNAYEVTVEVKDEHGQRVLTVTMALMVYRVFPSPEPPDTEGRPPNPWGA
jgi:hypothetical protein